jgi:hypothetical protein
MISVYRFSHTNTRPLLVTTSTPTTQPFSTFLEILFFTSPTTVYSQLRQFTKLCQKHSSFSWIYCHLSITYGFAHKSHNHHTNFKSLIQISLPDSLLCSYYSLVMPHTFSGLYTFIFHYHHCSSWIIKYLFHRTSPDFFENFSDFSCTTQPYVRYRLELLLHLMCFKYLISRFSDDFRIPIFTY